MDSVAGVFLVLLECLGCLGGVSGNVGVQFFRVCSAAEPVDKSGLAGCDVGIPAKECVRH